MTSDDKQIKDSAERFAKDTKGHRMQVLLNDGLYRHLRFRNPECSGYWYELVTWPGNLVFRGDGESYAFARAKDMFEFFGHGLHADGTVHINPHYWAEKLTSGDQTQEYTTDTFRKELLVQAQDFIDQKYIGRGQITRFRQEIQSYLDDEDYASIDLAVRSLDEFQFFNTEGHEWTEEHRKERTRCPELIQFEDCWEWIRHCKTYQWWYLWACHGIVHGIRQYYELFGRPAPTHDAPNTQDVARRGVPVA